MSIIIKTQENHLLSCEPFKRSIFPEFGQKCHTLHIANIKVIFVITPYIVDFMVLCNPYTGELNQYADWLNSLAFAHIWQKAPPPFFRPDYEPLPE